MIGVVRYVVWTKQIFRKRKMIQRILFLLFSSIFIVSYAQEKSFKHTQPESAQKGKSNFHGGVKVGFTASQITKDGFAFQGFNKFGGYAGVFANFPVSQNGKWLIQPELNFIMKGCKHTAKRDNDGNIYGDDYKLELMYGQIPILVKWRFFKGFELEVGPTFGILFKNTNVEKVNGYDNKGAPPFAYFEFSGIIGVGYLFFNHLGVNLRFEGSLLPVRKPKARDWLFLDGGQYNQTFSFCAYYQF